MAAISLRLPEDLAAKLEAEASICDKPRSEVMRDALAEYLARREKERFMAEFLAEASKGYANPAIRREAVELAEESLPLDNQALDAAEGRAPGEPWPEEQGERWWK
jgi:predicted transcriptional regulator